MTTRYEPIEWMDNGQLYILLKRREERRSGVTLPTASHSATEADIVAALQANPELRQRVLEQMPEMQHRIELVADGHRALAEATSRISELEIAISERCEKHRSADCAVCTQAWQSGSPSQAQAEESGATEPENSRCQVHEPEADDDGFGRCTCGAGSDEDCSGPGDHIPPCPASEVKDASVQENATGDADRGANSGPSWMRQGTVSPSEAVSSLQPAGSSAADRGVAIGAGATEPPAVEPEKRGRIIGISLCPECQGRCLVDPRHSDKLCQVCNGNGTVKLREPAEPASGGPERVSHEPCEFCGRPKSNTQHNPPVCHNILICRDLLLQRAVTAEAELSAAAEMALKDQSERDSLRAQLTEAQTLLVAHAGDNEALRAERDGLARDLRTLAADIRRIPSFDRSLAADIVLQRIDQQSPTSDSPAKLIGSNHVADGFLAELGCTVRDCLDCGCLVAGGPTRCKRCAEGASPAKLGGAVAAGAFSEARRALTDWQQSKNPGDLNDCLVMLIEGCKRLERGGKADG